MLYDVIYNGKVIGCALDYEQAIMMAVGMYGYCDCDELFIAEVNYDDNDVCCGCCDLCQYGDSCVNSDLLEVN